MMVIKLDNQNNEISSRQNLDDWIQEWNEKMKKRKMAKVWKAFENTFEQEIATKESQDE